jgi:Ca-activated chloride channel family protein
MPRIICLIAFLVPFGLFGQSGAIQGRIADAQTNEPLIGANITIDSSSFGAASDVRGLFLIQRIPPGVYTLKCTYLGYQPVIMRDVRVKATDTTKVEIRLKASSVQMNELVISADAVQAQRSIVSYMSIGRPRAPGNTEEYTLFRDNEFLDARSNPLSTFSIDVDVASYANVRRFIQSGEAPPPDAVRTEELLNYFAYDYPQPTSKTPFSITTNLSYAPWCPTHKLLLIGLQGLKVPMANLPPCNLVFLIDVSGSMDQPNKLPLVQASMRLLAYQLRPVDRVSIVVYASRAGLVLPATPGDKKAKILEAIEGLSAEGSTAGGEGIRLAYKVARDNFQPNGNNRIVWATDGDFNVGVSSTSELVRFVEEKRQEGVYLSVLGFGMGNLKDSRLEQLADKGNGNYAYIDNFTEARRALVGQLAGTLFTIAKDVKIQVEFNPLRVQAYRLIGYENRLLSKEDFNNDKKDAGELGSGHSVTALYEIVPPGVAFCNPKTDSLKYQRTSVTESAMSSRELLTFKLRYKPPSDTTSLLLVQTVRDSALPLEQTSVDFRFASAIAEFAMLLRDSPFKSDASFDALIARAKGSLGPDPEGDRSEFVRLAKSAKELVSQAATVYLYHMEEQHL